jgi:hypothetical protein
MPAPQFADPGLKSQPSSAGCGISCTLLVLRQVQVFLSYAGEDAFEAVLLKEALERLLNDLGVPSGPMAAISPAISAA